MARTNDDPTSNWLAALPVVDGVRPLDFLPATQVAIGKRAAYRRQRAPGQDGPAIPAQQVMSLVREGTVLRWQTGSGGGYAGQRRAGRAALPAGSVVKQYAFERLEGSKVYGALVSLDQKLTPAAAYAGVQGNGVRRLRAGVLQPFPDTKRLAGKKVLLFVHGTFSNSEALIQDGLLELPDGRKLLADAEKEYDFILVYDHPTLSVSPTLNAFDLAGLLRPAPRSIDIVCHSRGGLVARWFCEAFSAPDVLQRVLFVGSPLAGTSLASAPRLRSTFDLLTNVADALRAASDLASANAIFWAVSGLLRVVGTVTSLLSRAPIPDAAIALVPGLDGQSRTGNNEELRRLRMNTGNAVLQTQNTRYHAIASDFAPKEIGWNFLQFFCKPMQRIASLGADIVFEGKNDLVVDTASMSEVADDRKISLAHDFGTTDRVYHTNYFRQPETAAAIRKVFEIP